MPRLHIFNPDTDYALSSDREYYTPPANVVRIRRQKALLPAIYAKTGDAILLLDEPAMSIEKHEYYNLIIDKNLDIIYPADEGIDRQKYADYIPTPWGWNKNIRRILLDTIGEMPLMPSSESINKIRELSHRRLTIAMHDLMQPNADCEIEKPVEVFDVETALLHYNRNKSLFFKAPWSSSGRGIMRSADLELKHVEPWIRGIIRKQGSVMVEKEYSRQLDFASEWYVKSKEVRFLGFSVFNVSDRGKYHSNVKDSQSSLVKTIQEKSKQNLAEIIDAQRKAVEKLIQPFYEGPVGIDMLVTRTGNINPCVEVNLRHTMGMLYLLQNIE